MAAHNSTAEQIDNVSSTALRSSESICVFPYSLTFLLLLH